MAATNAAQHIFSSMHTNLAVSLVFAILPLANLSSTTPVQKTKRTFLQLSVGSSVMTNVTIDIDVGACRPIATCGFQNLLKFQKTLLAINSVRIELEDSRFRIPPHVRVWAIDAAGDLPEHVSMSHKHDVLFWSFA